MNKRQIAENALADEKYARVVKRIKNGEGKREAIKAEKLSSYAWGTRARRDGLLRTGAYTKAPSTTRKHRLTIQDIPDIQPAQGFFMVYGSPEQLSSFARGMR